jgi:hypothetical protein
MNIGEQVRTLYIEPIEEPPPTEDFVPVEWVPDQVPIPTGELDPA